MLGVRVERKPTTPKDLGWLRGLGGERTKVALVLVVLLRAARQNRAGRETPGLPPTALNPPKQLPTTRAPSLFT